MFGFVRSQKVKVVPFSDAELSAIFSRSEFTRWKTRHPDRYYGLLALLLTVHPITRFLLEIIRTDEPAVFGTGMSISQNISVLLFATAMTLWWWLSKQPRKIIWPLVAAAPAQKPAIRDGSRPRQPTRSLQRSPPSCLRRGRKGCFGGC